MAAVRLGCWLCTCAQTLPLPSVNPSGEVGRGAPRGFGEARVWTDVAARLSRVGEVEGWVPTAALVLVFLVLAVAG